MKREQINDLRRGNLVVYKSRGWKVNVLDESDTVGLINFELPIRENAKIEDIEPIPVSKDWLDCFNLKHSDDVIDMDFYDYYYSGKYLCMVNSASGQTEELACCEFVHELQNAYKVLAEKELIFTL